MKGVITSREAELDKEKKKKWQVLEPFYIIFAVYEDLWVKGDSYNSVNIK